MQCLLSTTYFGPIQWYQKLNRFDCLIDGCEPFIKQTYRNRCIIATTQGTQTLTVPIDHSLPIDHSPLTIDHSSDAPANVQCSMFNVQCIKDILISDHGNWRHLHWNALKSAYGESPFFEYYADDIRPFFEKKWKFLWDFNWEIMEKMCELLSIDHCPLTIDHSLPIDHSPLTIDHSSLTIDHSSDAPANVQCSMFNVQWKMNVQYSKDFRTTINPKHPQPDPDFVSKPYYQVYQQKHGFIPNLSILDLLFNMGNEAILYL